MKTHSIYNLVSILFMMIFTCHGLYAQTDSATQQIEYSEQLELLINENIETHHLWKFDALYWALLRPNITYEQKLKKDWSVLYGASFTWKTIKIIASNTYAATLEGYAAIRYYYNKKRRKRLGKNVNSFVGNYFGSRLGSSFSTFTYGKDEHIQLILPSGAIYYGLQRRLGKIGYLDIYWGIQALYPLQESFYGPARDFSFMMAFGLNIGFTFDQLKF